MSEEERGEGWKREKEVRAREEEVEQGRFSPVMKSWMAAISGSPFLGVTRFDLVCNELCNHYIITKLQNFHTKHGIIFEPHAKCNM